MSNLVLLFTLITANISIYSFESAQKNMYSYRLSIIIHVYIFLHQHIFPVASNLPGLYYPLYDIAINCGSSGSSTAADGRQWTGDMGSKLISLHGYKGKLISSKATGRPLSPDPVPYMTARLSRCQFTYEFQVTPGQKFIRLHFHPAAYPGFKRSMAFFTVKAGPYTLLSNFSAALTADALGTQFLVKEFCVNVEENQQLIITFTPSPAGSSGYVYAFINGIEIVSMPTGLYHTRESNPAARVVGKIDRFTIDDSITLELVQRLNVGGSSISSKEDTGMFRDWFGDSDYLVGSSIVPVTTTIPIRYMKKPAYTAPQKVYQTSWTMVQDKEDNNTPNFTWKLPVDLGFRYLLRLHFCELEYEIKESGRKEFSIFVNEQVVEANADVVQWSGGNGVAVHKDYVLTMEGDRMEGKRDLIIVVCPHKGNNYKFYERTDAILKGLEVFKLSNPDKNLAGVNPVPLVRSSTSGFQSSRKLVFSSGGNVIATCVVIFLALLNIIVYQLRILGEKLGRRNISFSLSEGLCRHFSLTEIILATNNFDDKLVIGSGGFGKVYKALIDGGATIVAIKRLHSNSKQGANEFWTEIEMLSNLRHSHLVSLIGYCDERNEMILVYEYMEHGTLADHLYKINRDGDDVIRPLSWEQRLNICMGAARGLDYLHTGTRYGIIHRDVKTTNILLDKDWVAKVSDFGLCKMGATSHSGSYVSTEVKGTFGYLDPEYFLTRRLTKKSDVYSFGVVLLEVLCGRAAVDLRLEEEQHGLSAWAQHCIKEEKLDRIIEPSLRDQISPQCLKVFADVASKCLHYRPNGRPTMADVVASLGSALALQDQCRNSSTGEEEEEEDVFSFGGSEQIEENIPPDDALSQGTFPPPSTLEQYDENKSEGKKRSKGWLNVVFQWSIALFGKGVDVPGRKRKDSDSDSELLQLDSPTQLFRHFSFAEIEASTNYFRDSLKIGEDGFSNLYKGWTDDGTIEVAIRRLRNRTSDVSWAEIKAQSQLCHPHILSLIGYCEEGRHWMLVYNYMVHMSLQDHLYRIGYDPLPWKKRLEICIGAARGLKYLHSVHVIHRDIKPTKILLDANWVAKVSVFQSSMTVATGITTRVCGTMGYLDPEYMYTFRLIEKSDVYSFGMVLLEVLCGRKPYDPSLLEGHRFLARWFRTNVRRKTIDQIIDRSLVGRIAPKCLREFVKIAWSCVHDQGTFRPSMNDVLWSLQIALQQQQTWDNELDKLDGLEILESTLH